MEENNKFSDEENEDQIPEDPETLGHGLIRASANGDAAEVASLLKRKADPNYTDKKNWTPLMWASSQGHTEIVKLLLEKNGKILMDGSEKPAGQHTPLHWSSFNGHIHVVWVLLKCGFMPNDIDKYGNNCIHQAVAGSRQDILETFLALGVHASHKNNRNHTPIQMTDDPQIKDMLQAAINAKKCKKCSSVFDIRNTKHLCQVCKQFFCANCKTLTWVFIAPDSAEEERPVLRCRDCQTLVDQAEYQLQEAIDSSSFSKLSSLIEKITTEKINVDVKIFFKAKKESERLKMENNINEFIGTLQYVENYKTIQKSIYLLKGLQETAENQGVKLDQKILDKIQKESDRLMAERNLRYELSVVGVADGTPEVVKKLEGLAQVCVQNEVSGTYVQKAKELIEKMKEIIESHNLLRKFIDYPVREYPDMAPPDPKKKPNPAEEAKKKKAVKIPIPAWAEELPALVKSVEALEAFLKKSAHLEIPQSFLEQARENIARMRKEIRFRQMEDEEAKALADKKLADKNKKK